MMAPTAISDVIKNEKDFDLDINSKIYKIKFKQYDSSIIIYIEDKNVSPQIIYEQNFSYDYICQKSKIFKIYENISEIYNSLLDFMEKKKYTFEIEGSSAFLNFNLDVGSFSFEMFIKKTSINDSYSFLTEKIEYLLEENKEIKNKMNLLFEENKELKNRIIYLEEEIESMKEKDKVKEDELFRGSSILQSIEEKKMISDWILPKAKIFTHLIYRAKRDGDKASDFHSKCDNRGPLLIIIQTMAGNRFGGYTNKSWTSPLSNDWPEDGNAFIFSLDLKRKFINKEPKQAVGHYIDKGPVFGYGHAFDISSECLHNDLSYHSATGSYEGLKQIILTDEKNFRVEDYEVFQIKFQ